MVRNTSGPELHPTPLRPIEEGPVPIRRIDTLRLAIGGLRDTITEIRISRAEKGLATYGEDADVYVNAARESLALQEPKPAYDPLKSWQSKHRSLRGGFGEVDRELPSSTSGSPRTSIQGMALVRANLRIDATNKRRENVDKYVRLYGEEVMTDKTALKEELKNGRYTRSEKKAMKIAEKSTRRSIRSSNRIYRRLGSATEQQDVAGTVSRSRRDSARRKVDRLSTRLEKRREKRLSKINPEA